MAAYKVLLRNDRGSCTIQAGIVETTETIDELLSHAHILEVFEEFTGTYDKAEVKNNGFTYSFTDTVVKDVDVEVIEKQKKIN